MNDEEKRPHDGGRGRRREDRAPSPAQVQPFVDKAVRLLGVQDFITNSIAHFGPKLESFHTYAKTAPGNGDMIFMALSLPIANGVIHVGSDGDSLKRAKTWIQRATTGRNPDPFSILSVLVLIAIAQEGRRRHSTSLKEKATWEEIAMRMENLARGVPVELDAAGEPAARSGGRNGG